MEYGEFKPSSNERTISQSIYVSYLSENQSNLDEQVIDIISWVGKVKMVSFVVSKSASPSSERYDRFIDRVVLRLRG